MLSHTDTTASPKTNQSIEHQRVIGVLFWSFHHNVEQSIKSVLKKLCIKQKPIRVLILKEHYITFIKSEYYMLSAAFVTGQLTLTISPPSTSISLCRIWSKAAGFDLQFKSPSRSTDNTSTHQTTISRYDTSSVTTSVKVIVLKAWNFNINLIRSASINISKMLATQISLINFKAIWGKQ